MKSLFAATTLVATLFVTCAQAQTMTCGDYLKADKQIAGAMAGATPSTGNKEMDAQAAAMDQKVRAYCTKNPSADLNKAMEQALQ
jgi:hypothetical protein